MAEPFDAHASGASDAALPLLRLLVDETRWRLIQALRRSDYQVGALAQAVALPQNLVSYHLGLLRQAGLVQVHRSDADARALYYGLDLPVMQAAYQQIGAGLLLPEPGSAPLPPAITVVFLCTGNSARSQMAEGWLRHLSQGRVPARSAGTQPRSLHPLATQAMAEAGVDIGFQQAKALEALDSLTPDVVVTVCDLAREQCPDWQAQATHLHWSIPDPAAVEAASPTQLQLFRQVRDALRVRVAALLPLLVTIASQGPATGQ